MFGFEQASFIERPDVDNLIYLGHITRNSIEHIKKLDHPIIVPLRHPSLVEESWRRRGKSTTDLRENFRLLVDEIDPLNPLYLPIDVPDRQTYLDRINSELGLNLVTDWGVVNSQCHTFDIARKESNIEPDFISRFY